MRTLVLFACVLAATALADPAPSWWRPVPLASADGWRPERAFWYTTWMCVVAFVLVVVALFGFSIKYRNRPGRRAFYDHGTNRQAFFVTAGLALLVFVTIDMRLVQMSQVDIKEHLFKWPTGDDTVRIEVLAQQWAWNIRYAGPDGTFNTPDDVVTLNDMRVPLDRPVMVNLKAKDVIHSFYVPAFRLKHDANPGYVTRTWFKATKPGLYEIACSQMCGWAHYKMRGELTVLPADGFERWYEEAQGDAQRRFDPADTEAQWGWDWVQ